MFYRTAMVVAMSCATWSCPARAEEKTQPVRPNDKVAAQLERKLPEIKFSGQSFEDVIDFTRDVSGANLFVNWRTLEAAGIARKAPITMRLRDITFKTFLVKLLEAVSTPKARAEFTVDEGVIVISIARDPKADASPPLVNGVKLPQTLDRVLPEVNFNGQGLADVIDFLRDVTGENIFVNWNALNETGIKQDSPVTIRLKDVRFSTVLKRVLESVTADIYLKFTFADNVITITTGRPEKTEQAEK